MVIELMKNDIRVTFFGDSICTGQHVAIHQGWVTQSSASLAQKFEYQDQSIVVTNSSVNGRTTRQALETISYEIQSHQPDIVVIQFGMNDCNHWNTDQGLPLLAKVFPQICLKLLLGYSFWGEKSFPKHKSPDPLNKSPSNTQITYQEKIPITKQFV